MLGRSLIVAVMIATSAFALPARAGAQILAPGLDYTVDEVAASVDFPLYQATRGVPKDVAAHGAEKNCHGRAGVSVDYGKPGHVVFSVAEDQRPCPLLQTPRHRTARILGRRVSVGVYCATASCGGAPASALSYSARFTLRAGGKATAILVSGQHTSFQQFVRAARSLRHVNLGRPEVQIRRFLSADGSIWCSVADGQVGGTYTWCATKTPSRRGQVVYDGTVNLCDQAAQQSPDPCVSNWDENVPSVRLLDGQRTTYGGFSCLMQAAVATCTDVAGQGAGTGFRIDATSLTAIGPV